MNIERNGLMRMERYPTHVSMTIAIWSCAALILFLSGCKNNPVDAPIKNPREYTWTIDTLNSPGSFQTLLTGLYAFNSENLWIVGHSASLAGKVWHYDGSAWSPIYLSVGSSMDMAAIVGFGKDNIWAVGSKWPQDSPRLGLILHYNGSTWSELEVDNINPLESAWGSGPDDVWFGGINGTLLHYDGVSIRPDSVPMFIPKHANPSWIFFKGASRTADNGYVLLTARPFAGQGYWDYLFKRQAAKWQKADSLYGLQIGTLWYSPWGKLYRGRAGIDVLEGDTWKFVFDGAAIYGICGTSENNLFGVGASSRDGLSGEIYHWNGSNVYRFDNLSTKNIELTQVWTDEREAFVVGNDGVTSYIFHGK